MPFERGEVVLLAFPFSSETGVKQRPALVLLDPDDQDLLVARVTTQRYQSPFDVELGAWKEAGLLAASWVRLHKLAAVERRLVRRRLGRLSRTDWSMVQSVLQKMFAEV
jgi:mRNA interferase MazF